MRSPIRSRRTSSRSGSASYSATAYALERHKAISGQQRERLLSFEPKQIKRRLLEGYEPSDWRLDVWLLTDRDEGVLIEGGRHDLFVIRLRENSSAGYLWDFDALTAAGFALVADDQEVDDPSLVGGVLMRRVTARSSQRAHGEVTLQESRPWLPHNPCMSCSTTTFGVRKSPECGTRADASAAGRVMSITVSKDLGAHFGPARDQDPRGCCQSNGNLSPFGRTLPHPEVGLGVQGPPLGQCD